MILQTPTQTLSTGEDVAPNESQNTSKGRNPRPRTGMKAQIQFLNLLLLPLRNTKEVPTRSKE